MIVEWLVMGVGKTIFKYPNFMFKLNRSKKEHLPEEPEIMKG